MISDQYADLSDLKPRGTGSSEMEGLLDDIRVSAWADLMIKKWQAKIDSLGIGNKGLLERSFSATLIWEMRGANNIEYLQRIAFKFLRHGRFVDYGIGRGTNLRRRFERGSNPKDNVRKRKEWIYEPWREHQRALIPLVQFRARKEIVYYILSQSFKEDIDTRFQSKLEQK